MSLSFGLPNFKSTRLSRTLNFRRVSGFIAYLIAVIRGDSFWYVQLIKNPSVVVAFRYSRSASAIPNMSAENQTPSLSTADPELTDRSKAADKEVDMTQVAANAEEKKEKATKPKKEKKDKPAQQPKAQQQKKKVDEGSALIGITTTKEEDLADWYQQVLLKGEFLEYSDIPGCFILNVSQRSPVIFRTSG